MPMVDVYAAAGTFGDPHAVAQALATELMTVERRFQTSRCSARTRRP